MTDASMEVEQRARAFPRPENSRPARSVTYHSGGRVYRAAIGQPRSRCGGVYGAPGSGSAVLSIVATGSAVEIWCLEPARDWPNPSVISRHDVLSIDYLDHPDAIAR
ncbi:MAG: hypothetical protein ACTHJW_10785 [Streptosporangiaceae bacterium]